MAFYLEDASAFGHRGRSRARDAEQPHLLRLTVVALGGSRANQRAVCHHCWHLAAGETGQRVGRTHYSLFEQVSWDQCVSFGGLGDGSLLHVG